MALNSLTEVCPSNLHTIQYSFLAKLEFSNKRKFWKFTHLSLSQAEDKCLTDAKKGTETKEKLQSLLTTERANKRTITHQNDTSN